MTVDPGRPPTDAAAHVLVADVEAPALDAEELHHLRRVRRLAPSSRCTLTDGRGSWRWCRLGPTGVLEPDGPVVRVERPHPEITIAIALTKGEKPDLVVQKLTELGVDRIVPFRAEHSVVRWDDAKAAAHHRRWETIARSALAQSRGCWLPQVDPCADLDAVVALGATRLDRAGAAPSLERCALAVGPEGGWSAREIEALPDTVTLGPTLLRAETAAITAGAILTAFRSGIADPMA